MIATSIVFDHRGRTARTAEGPLEVRVTIARKPYYISTGVRVRRNQWAAGRVVSHPQADELNERLAAVLSSVMREVNACLAGGRAVSAADIRRRVYGLAEGDTSFRDWAREQVDALGIREGTRKHYETLLRRMGEFGRLEAWQDVTVERIYEFDRWLHALRRRGTSVQAATGELPPALSDAAVHTYHKCLRCLLGRAVRTGRLAASPYGQLRGEFRHGEKESTEYLTEEEMAAVESLRPVPGSQMALARDLFVFQMYTGLSYADAQAFDITRYKKVGGTWRSTAERIKTGVPYVNQLLPPAVEVLERYGMKIPRLGNADYNKCLKALGMAAGIGTPLHSHLARHTFATYMLRNGVKIENLSKMLGHTSVTRTQRYAKVLAESVHEDFEMIGRLLEKRRRGGRAGGKKT